MDRDIPCNVDIKIERVPDKYAVMLTVGEHGPIYLEYIDMFCLMTDLEEEQLKMIGEGYAG